MRHLINSTIILIIVVCAMERSTESASLTSGENHKTPAPMASAVTLGTFADTPGLTSILKKAPSSRAVPCASDSAVPESQTSSQSIVSAAKRPPLPAAGSAAARKARYVFTGRAPHDVTFPDLSSFSAEEKRLSSSQEKRESTKSSPEDEQRPSLTETAFLDSISEDEPAAQSRNSFGGNPATFPPLRPPQDSLANFERSDRGEEKTAAAPSSEDGAGAICKTETTKLSDTADAAPNRLGTGSCISESTPVKEEVLSDISSNVAVTVVPVASTGQAATTAPKVMPSSEAKSQTMSESDPAKTTTEHISRLATENQASAKQNDEKDVPGDLVVTEVKDAANPPELLNDLAIHSTRYQGKETSQTVNPPLKMSDIDQDTVTDPQTPLPAALHKVRVSGEPLSNMSTLQNNVQATFTSKPEVLANVHGGEALTKTGGKRSFSRGLRYDLESTLSHDTESSTTREYMLLSGSLSASSDTSVGRRDSRHAEGTILDSTPLITTMNAKSATQSRSKSIEGASQTVGKRSTSSFRMNDRAVAGNKPSSTTQIRPRHPTTRSQDSDMKTPTLTPSNQLVAIGPGDDIVDRRGKWPMKKEYTLYLLAVALIFVLATVLGFLFWPSRSPPWQQRTDKREAGERSYGTCASVSCTESTLYLSNLISWGLVNPCNNFYLFVCRRWTPRFASPFVETVSTDDDYAGFVEKKLGSTLRNKSQISRVLRPFRGLYEQCNNLDAAESSGWNRLLELMREMSPEESSQNFSIWTTAAKFYRMTGTTALLSVSVAAHPSWTNRDIASVGPPELLTTDAGVEAAEAARLYAAALTTVSKGRHWPAGNFPPAKTISLLTFGGELEKIGDVLRKNTARLSMADSHLLEFLTEAFSDVEHTPFIGTKPEVLIRSPHLVSEIQNLVARTDAETVLNYLKLRLTIHMAPFLPYTKLTDIQSTLLYGKLRKGLSRWQLCVRVAEKVMSPLVHAHLYADLKLYTAMSALSYFVEEVIDEFKAEIDNSSYFDASSKTAIRNILSETNISVVGPGWTRDKALVERYIDRLPSTTPEKLSLKNYVGHHQSTFAHAIEGGSRIRWTRSVFTTDCWSEPYPRTLYVPLLAFDGTQVLGTTVADAMHLSRLAPRLARCLFDVLMDEARSEGESWLNANTWRSMLHAEECFEGRQDYRRFGGLRDVLAARVSYRLFAKRVNVDEQLAVPLVKNYPPITAAQVYFASLMLQNCESGSRPHWIKKSVAGEDWEVALRHVERFATAFNCPEKSFMNPAQRCASGGRTRGSSIFVPY